MANNVSNNDKRVIMFNRNNSFIYFVIENNRLKTVRVEALDAFNTDDIVMCKVSNRKKELNGYFVKLSSDVNGLLLDEDNFVNKTGSGDDILVQIKKEAYDNKVCTVTTKLSLKGKYTIVQLCDEGAEETGFSKKLSANKKNEIKTFIRESKCDLNGFKITFRTDCEKMDDETIFAELLSNIERLKRIDSYKEHYCCYKRVYSYSFLTELLNAEYEYIACDNASLDYLEAYCKENNISANYKLFNDDKLTPSLMYGLRKKLDDITSEKVWLKSGGYLFINNTPALTVIDVNSGKSEHKGDKERAVLATNLEALEEIVYQIGARNISGIIIIDFVNMKDNSSKTILINNIKEKFVSIKPSIRFVDFTKLGLVEATREKKRVDIYETVKMIDKNILL